MRSHFEGFQGFCPESGMKFGAFTHESPREAAIKILKSYRGKEVKIWYYPIITSGTERGIKKIEIDLFVPQTDDEIEKCIKYCDTNNISLDFRGGDLYDLQMIKIGDEIITEIDTNIDK